MKSERFAQWFADLPHLNQPQRARVQDALHPAAGLDRIVALIAAIRGRQRRCPRWHALPPPQPGQWPATLPMLRLRAHRRRCHRPGGLARIPVDPAPAARLDTQALLVTDAHAAYRAFAKRQGIAHGAVNVSAGERLRHGMPEATHVQNANACHSHLKQWLMPVRDVASRYLSNYLGWRWALDGNRISTVEQLLSSAISFIHRQQ